MKCQLCDKKATRIANVKNMVGLWDGAMPDYARTGIIVMCTEHIMANTFNRLQGWEVLEYPEEARQEVA